VFTWNKPPKPHQLDEVIDSLISSMKGVDEDTEIYAANVKQLKTLMELRAADRRDRRPLSSDQLLAVGANLLGILAILQHERANVITTKALGFVPKINVNP
jgi:hypothetical protein